MSTQFDSIVERLQQRSPRRVHELGAREAAVAMILVPTDATSFELLLIERAKRAGDPWSGQMALPGGRREDGDATLLETVTRETREETGVELSPDSLLGELDDLFPNISVLPKIVVRPFVFGLKKRPTVAANSEVATHVWASLDTLRGSHRVEEVVVGEARRTVDAFVLGERVIWGITYRILARFLDVGL